MKSLQISTRGITAQSSPIRKLAPFAEQAKKNGINIFHLNIGQPDIPSPPKALEFLKTLNMPIIEYTHSAGILSLRQEFAKYYKQLSIDVNFENILITVGGSEALLNVLANTLDVGDEVIVPEPYYANYLFFTHILGIKIVPLACDIKNNFALPSIEKFEESITPKTKAILINNPGNPTGILYSNEELSLLKDVVKRNNLYLISDEVYREFCYDGIIHKSILHLEDMQENAIVIDSFSKRYSLCGIRIGAIITRNQDVIDNCLKFSQSRLSPPTLGQIIAEISLKSTDNKYLTDMRDEYQKRRDIVYEGLKEIPNVISPRSSGAFYCMAELPVDDADAFCQWLLEKFSYKGSTLMLAPGTGFYTRQDLGKKQVRIAYVLNEEKLKHAIECLKIALLEYNKK